MPSNQDEQRAVRGAQSVHRVALLLRAIASSQEAGSRLVHLARQTNLERPTIHRLLRGLIHEGLVDQDPSTVGAGIAVIDSLGAKRHEAPTSAALPSSSQRAHSLESAFSTMAR